MIWRLSWYYVGINNGCLIQTLCVWLTPWTQLLQLNMKHSHLVSTQEVKTTQAEFFLKHIRSIRKNIDAEKDMKTFMWGFQGLNPESVSFSLNVFQSFLSLIFYSVVLPVLFKEWNLMYKVCASSAWICEGQRSEVKDNMRRFNNIHKQTYNTLSVTGSWDGSDPPAAHQPSSIKYWSGNDEAHQRASELSTRSAAADYWSLNMLLSEVYWKL